MNDKYIILDTGDRVHYDVLHRDLRTANPKSYCCSFCKTKTAKRYDWALKKDYQYSYDINNYIELCTSCHRKYDFTEEIRTKISKGNKGKVPYNKGHDARYIKKCKWCDKEFKTYRKTSTFCSNSCKMYNQNNEIRNEQLNK